MSPINVRTRKASLCGLNDNNPKRYPGRSGVTVTKAKPNRTWDKNGASSSVHDANPKNPIAVRYTTTVRSSPNSKG